jgi:3-methyladenine DNA glycosylase Tag
MHAPEKVKVTSLADYLAVMTRAAFQSGLSWEVIERKWPGFVDAFAGFDPEKVAGLTPPEVDALLEDARIVRNRKKVEATVYNAGELIATDREYGGFKKYLRSFPDYDSLVKDLRKRFKFMGETGAYYFLYVVGEKVPAHEEWAKAHGVPIG